MNHILYVIGCLSLVHLAFNLILTPLQYLKKFLLEPNQFLLPLNPQR